MTYRLSRPLQSALLILSLVLSLTWAYQHFGGLGLAAVLGAVVMFALVYLTRFMKVMQRAARRPVGYVGSAVMLHAKLSKGMSLFRVVSLTGALGQARTAPGVEPELFLWADESLSSVECEFAGGRLRRWTLLRPDVEVADAGQ